MTPPLPEVAVALDLETTGLHPFFSQICEVGAVAFVIETGEVVAEYTSLINPGVTMPQAVIAIHGITDDMVADSPRLATVFPELRTFLAPFDLVIGHNVSFDLGFVRHRAAQLQQPLACTCCIDTVKLAKWAFPGLTSYRLTMLTQVLGIAVPQAHRALHDAEATRSLFLRAWAQLIQAGHDPAAMFQRLLKPIDDVRINAAQLTPAMAQLYHCCEHQTRLIITYANAQQETTRRVIDPLGMQLVGGSHYVVAHCHFKQANRNFRIDRILEWETVGEIPLDELLAQQGLLPLEVLHPPIEFFEPDPPIEVA